MRFLNKHAAARLVGVALAAATLGGGLGAASIALADDGMVGADSELAQYAKNNNTITSDGKVAYAPDANQPMMLSLRASSNGLHNPETGVWDDGYSFYGGDGWNEAIRQYVAEQGQTPSDEYIYQNYDYWLGSYNLGDQGKGYCLNWGRGAGTSAEYATMQYIPAQDSETARRVGWVIATAGQSDDPMENAATQYIVHTTIDGRSDTPNGEPGNGAFEMMALRKIGGQTAHGFKDVSTTGGTPVGDTTIGAIIQRADQLWAESANHAHDANLQFAENKTDAQRHGTVKNIRYKDADGNYADTDVTATVTSDNVTFDKDQDPKYGGTVSADGKTWTGRTNKAFGDDGVYLKYTATGDGEATFHLEFKTVVYTYHYGSNPAGRQNMAKWGNPLDAKGDTDSPSYRVQYTFQPTLKSNQTDHRTENGQAPEDDLVFSAGTLKDGTGADGTNKNTWITGAQVKATGVLYRFDQQPVEGKTSVKDGVKVATATATGTKDGDKVHVGKDSMSIDPAYAAAHAGAAIDRLPANGWYTWVWTISSNDQTPDVAKMLTTDPDKNPYTWTDSVLTAETTEHHRNMQPAVTSSTSDAYAGKPGFTDDGKITHVEKGAPLRDVAKLTVKDSNNDGKVDTSDWLHTTAGWGEGKETEANQITIKVKGEYLAATTKEKAKELQEKAAKGEVIDSYDGMKVVATTEFTTNKAGDYLTSSDPNDKPTAQWKAVDGYTLEDLPTGYGTFRYLIQNQDQDTKSQTGIAPSKDYPFAKDVDEGYFQTDQVIEKHVMQPTVTSSTSDAYKDDQSTVTGADGTDRPAVQLGSTADQDKTDVTYIEKGTTIRDTATVGVEDINGDGKTDTLDWLHTTEGIKTGKIDESTQITIKVKGTLWGGMTREEAEAAQKQADSGKTPAMPKDAIKLATTEFTTNKAGDNATSSDESEKPAGVWTAVDGIDLKNLPSGYATFVYDITNKDQDTKAQTGVAPHEATDELDGYPFKKDVHERPFSHDETIMIRLKPSLDSTVSSKEVKPGETTTDKLVVRPSANGDVWPTYPQTNVTEGEKPKGVPLSLDFHGVLYKVSDEPSATIEETDTVPEGAVKVHETDIKGVTGFGESTTDSYTLTEKGTYAWHWTMTPSLSGDQNHNPLDAMAWRQLTHGKVQHAFGLASEIVRVNKEDIQCEVSTKSQGEVTMTGGKADLHDVLELKNCENAAKAEFELWKQSNGDQSGDVLIKVTGQVDAKDGATSPTVTVTQTGTYYWREKVYDKEGKLISYGDARKPNETVTVKPEEKPLAATGVTIGLIAGGVILLLAAGGLGVWFTTRKPKDTADADTVPAGSKDAA